MEHIIETPDGETVLAPAEAGAQPISIRKLDRLETTSASFANGG
jgi:hypothetical protein